MKTVVRNSYTPKAGDYCNTIVIDKETNNQYLFDGDGVWTKLPAEIDAEALIQQAYELSKAYIDQIAATIPTAVSQLENDSGFVTALTSSLVNYYTKSLIDNKVNDLQSQIDAISSSSDVVDVVGTYVQLQAYDTSRLSDNDIIKVLVDETHDDAISYYRWDSTNNAFVYVGSQGPFYTKAESDARFVPQTRTINGKALNQNITLTAEDIGSAVYDASWLFEENPCTAVHLAELVDALENNTPIVVRQADGDGYQTFTMTVTDYSDDTISVSAVLSLSEQSGDDVNLFIAAPTFTIDRTTREVSLLVGSLDAQAIWQAIDGKVGFTGYITGTNASPTDGASLAPGIYRASESQNTSYVSLPMENGTTKRQSVAKGGIVIRTVSRLIVLGTQNIMYQYDTGNQYFYEGEPVVESVIRRDYSVEGGYATLGVIAPPNTYYITSPINSLEAELNTGDTGHTRITFTVEDGISSGDFYLDITHSSGEDVIWSNGVVPEPAEGETWIFEVYGKTVEAIRFSDTPGGGGSVAWADITGKPTNVSYWTNDAGYITSAALPTNVSDLTNDAGYITSSVNNLANYYTQTQVNNMFNSLPTIPTATSDLTNDSGFITTADLPIATTSSVGMVQVGTGLSIDQNGVLSATGGGGGSVAWNDITGKPSDVSYWTNDAGYITLADLPSVPTKTSDLVNDSGFITTSALSNYYTKSETYTQAEVNGLFNGLSTVASTGDYDDLTDKPQITYTGTTITDRVVTQNTVTEPISGTKPIGSYGPFNYIPLDMSSYTSSAASRSLIPENHLPDGFYVVTASGYMRLGSDTKILKPGTLLYWFENELYILGYNACEYWYYDPDNDEWGGGYFTTQEDVEYIIDQKGLKWVDVASGAFLVRNRDDGYYTFSYSSASGTTRRITISVNGTNTYYFPYNDTALIKSESGVLMLGRYNLWFAYNGTDYNAPVSIAAAFTGTDGVTAGTGGLVPAPATTDADKFLKSDGTWAAAGTASVFINDYLTFDSVTGQYTITTANAEALRDLVITHTPLYYKEEANYVGTNAVLPVSATWTAGSPYGNLVLHADGPYGGQITFDIMPGSGMDVYMGASTAGRSDAEVAFAYPGASMLYQLAAGGGDTVDMTTVGTPYYWAIYAVNGINYFKDSTIEDPGQSDAYFKADQFGSATRSGVSYNYFQLTAFDSSLPAGTYQRVLYRLVGTTLTVLPLETESVIPDDVVYADTGAVATPTPWVQTSDIVDGAVTSDKIDWTTLAPSLFAATSMPVVENTTISTAWASVNLGSTVTVSGLDPSATYVGLAHTVYCDGGVGEFRLIATGNATTRCDSYNRGDLQSVSWQFPPIAPNSSGQIVFQRQYRGEVGTIRMSVVNILLIRVS